MMGWLWVWLRDREERRAEAAVRRQMVALEGGRRLASERDDLIAQGVDPAELEVPIAPRPHLPDPRRPDERPSHPYGWVHGPGWWATGRDEPETVVGRRCLFVEGGGQTVAGRVIAWTDQPCYDVELYDGSRRMVLARFLSWVEAAAPQAGAE